jgi:hypothetical protein
VSWQLPSLACDPQTQLNVAMSRSKCGWLFDAHQSHSATRVGHETPQHALATGGAVPTHGQLGTMLGALTHGPHSWYPEPLHLQ